MRLPPAPATALFPFHTAERLSTATEAPAMGPMVYTASLLSRTRFYNSLLSPLASET